MTSAGQQIFHITHKIQVQRGEPVNKATPASPTEAIQLPRTLLNDIWEMVKNAIHTRQLISAARAVAAISGDKVDMQRLAATFDGKLVHASVHAESLQEIADLKARILSLENSTQLLTEAEDKIKQKDAELRALRKLTKNQQEAFRALLEFLGKTPEEIEEIMSKGATELEEQKRQIERARRQLRKQGRNTTHILALLKQLD